MLKTIPLLLPCDLLVVPTYATWMDKYSLLHCQTGSCITHSWTRALKTAMETAHDLSVLAAVTVKVMARLSRSCEDIPGTLKSLATQCVCV